MQVSIAMRCFAMYMLLVLFFFFLFIHYKINTTERCNRRPGKYDPFSENNCDLHAIHFHSQINEWVMNVLEIQIRSIEIRFSFGNMQCSHRKFKWAQHGASKHVYNNTCTHIGCDFDFDFDLHNIWMICAIESERNRTSNRPDQPNECFTQANKHKFIVEIWMNKIRAALFH